jgi:ABC-type transporter Mla maintaining outer membrane lipid asymmetry ATPase subunit MlaF
LIVVTHDVRGAKRLGDRIVVLDKGRLIADGSFGQIEHSDSEVARNLVTE